MNPLPHDTARPWRPTIILIAAVTLARLLYLALLCPYTLIEDETNYWEWSRHLSLSYYTKGPGIAWTIAAFTRVLGETAFAIRAISVLASALAAACVAGLTFDLFRSHRAAFYAAAVLFLMPVFQSLALLTTIDGPYSACWAVAAWSAHRTLSRRSPAALLALAAALGVGVLYKYTMLIFLPGLLLAWAGMKPRPEGGVGSSTPPAPRSSRPRLSPLHLLLALLLFAALISPIVVWNHQQGWPTLRHLLGHLAVPGGDQYVRHSGGWVYKPQWTLAYIGTQLAIAGPMLLLALLTRLDAKRRRAADPARWAAVRFCLALSEPIFVLYFLVSFLTQPQGNWALAGFITLIPLAAMAVPALAARTRLSRFAWHATIAVGLVTGLGMLRLDLFTSLPYVGKYVPIWRVTGADRMAAHAQQLADEVEAETGQTPFIMALHYGRASQFAFYMPGRPTVFCCSSLLLNGRIAPYDFWEDTDLRARGTRGSTPPSDRFPSLIGRPAVLNGASLKDWQPLFDRVVEVGTLRADGKRDRPAFKAYGFRGFPKGGLRSEGAPPTLEDLRPHP